MSKSIYALSKNVFDGILLDAINQTLFSLGKYRRKKVFSYLEKELGIKRQDIPSKIPEFSYAVEKALGSEAFNYKTRLLIEIQKKLGENVKPKLFDCFVPELTFEDYIQIKQLLFLTKQ